MDEQLFDTLAKGLGSGTSRRRVLRGLLGSSVAGAAIVSRTIEAQAAKQCKKSSQCPQDQICIAGACDTCPPDRPQPCEGTLSGECCPAGAQCCLCQFNSRGDTRGGCAPAGFVCETIFSEFDECHAG
jgi:hypothetical protein